MLEGLLELTSLPNLHPAVVHFPIALLPMAILLDALAMSRRAGKGLAAGATFVYCAAALGAAAAVWAGESAADSLRDVPARLQPHLATHSDWGHYAAYALGATALARLGVAWLERRRPQKAARWATILVGLLAVVVVLRATDLGGALVYRHGVGVSVGPPPSVDPPVAAATDHDQISRGADGTLTWRPRSADTDLETLFTIVSDESTGMVTPVALADGGVALAVRGEAYLLFPGTFDDVQIEIEVDLQDYSGTIGLAHHLQSPTEGRFFEVALDTGVGRLVTLAGGRRKVLDEARLPDSPGFVRLGVSATGRHLKGLVAGDTVLHGHEPSGEPGRCGLLLAGEGTLGIRSFRLTPLGESDAS